MSHHAHGTNRNLGHASRPVPTLPVRTVQERRHGLGWGECPAEEFMRLLALHNAGKINLLEMPETAADAVDELPEDEADEQPADPRRLGAISRTKGSLGIVITAVSQSPTPMTVREIVGKTGLTEGAVRGILQKNPRWFTCVSADGHVKRWQRANQEQGAEKGL
jgi:hypothetical protein